MRISRQSYDQIYERRDELSLLQEVDSQSLDDSRIAALRSTGFLSRSDLAEFETLFRQFTPTLYFGGAGSYLLDVGCGSGGFGAWLADRISLRLLGIDFSKVAIIEATNRWSSRGAGYFSFLIGDFHELPIQESSIAAVLSLDGIYMARNPERAVAEVARVTAPGSPFIFTYYISESGKTSTNSSSAWIEILESHGFDVVSTEDLTATWRTGMREKHGRRWHNRSLLREELGPEVDLEIAVSAKMLGVGGEVGFLNQTSRLRVIAKRRLSSLSRNPSK